MYINVCNSSIHNIHQEIAKLIGATSKEIIFTSGATESNNMAIKGVARFYRGSGDGKKRHIITTQTEHKCVLDSCRVLESEGFEVTYLSVNQSGLIDLEELKTGIPMLIIVAHNLSMCQQFVLEKPFWCL